MKVVELAGGPGIKNLRLGERPMAAPDVGEVQVRLKAASLNYRDLLAVQGLYSKKMPLPLIPLSDGAGEVTRIGAGVTRFKPGDRVTVNFLQGWIGGAPSQEKFATSLGGTADGVLSEYRCFSQDGLVPTPDYLSDEEAAALPCAALTAWSAIITQGGTGPGDRVLVQGTGGVSLFALQFAKLAGAEVIATSSSPAKLERVKALGADHLIDYRATPDWGKAARALTGGRGLDHIVEVGGAGTLNQSIRAIRIGGIISMIGVLSGPSHELLIPLVVMQNIRLQGVTVGSREDFEAMLRAMALHRIRPPIDRVFAMDEIQAAFEHMAAGRHFGKIIVRI